MKQHLLQVGLVFLLSALLALFGLLWKQERWTVEAAASGKWRSCLEEREWYLPWSGKGCGSPMSYDEAIWWSETSGGRIYR